MAALRTQLKQNCLVGCVGDENAGKTTLIRFLMGLPAEKDAHLKDKATANVVAHPMPVNTSAGWQGLPASPVVLDAPGLVDARQTLAECALRHQGKHEQSQIPSRQQLCMQAMMHMLSEATSLHLIKCTSS